MKQWIWILGWFTFLMGSLGMVWKVLRWSKLNWAVCCGCFNAVNHRLFAGKENMVCHVSPISPPFGALWSDNDPQDCLDWFDEFAFDDILERFGESAEVSHELVRESVCVRIWQCPKLNSHGKKRPFLWIKEWSKKSCLKKRRKILGASRSDIWLNKYDFEHSNSACGVNHFFSIL